MWNARICVEQLEKWTMLHLREEIKQKQARSLHTLNIQLKYAQ